MLSLTSFLALDIFDKNDRAYFFKLLKLVQDVV